MTTCAWRLHRPRQVIVVVFLTSVFWFLLNTIILFTYQGSRPVGADGGYRRAIRGERDELLVQFGRASEIRARSKLPLDAARDKKRLAGNIAGRIESKQPIHAATTAHEGLEADARDNVGKGISASFTSKTKQASNQRQIAITTILSWHAKTPKFLDESTNPSRDPNEPGEQGRPVTIGEDEKDAEKEGYKKHAFNELASRKISLHRSIPDTRNPG